MVNRFVICLIVFHFESQLVVINLMSFVSFINLFAGIYEALELRDGGSDYLGKGVSKVSYLLFLLFRYKQFLTSCVTFADLFLYMQAVGNVNTIIGPALVGKVCCYSSLPFTEFISLCFVIC